MPNHDRELLFKIHEAVIKMTKSPPTTYAPQTGDVEKPGEYSPNTYPLPLPVNTENQR